MTLPVSGPISLGSVGVELGNSTPTTISLSSDAVRTLAQVPTGQISLSDLYGKTHSTMTLLGNLVVGYLSVTGGILGYINEGTYHSGSLNPSVIDGRQISQAAYYTGLGAFTVAIYGAPFPPNVQLVKVRNATTNAIISSFTPANGSPTMGGSGFVSYAWYSSTSGPVNPFGAVGSSVILDIS